MEKIVCILTILCISVSGLNAKSSSSHKSSYNKSSSTSVRSYVKKDGTYIKSHKRTTPDSTMYNNYSTKGNINPYTGEEGTVTPYK